MGKAVGGGSLVIGGAMLRAPSDVFEQVDKDGERLWPTTLSREVLNPYYDIVERNLKVGQLSWDEVPKKGGVFAKMLNKLGYTCDRGRFCIVDCRHCGWCGFGCMYDRKQSLILNYIPQAEQNNAKIRTRCEAREISPSDVGYKVSYIDRYGVIKEIEAKILIIACGAVDSAALLLRSKKNLPLLSEQVGKNLNINGNLQAFALVADNELSPETYKGVENGGVITYHFWKEKKFLVWVMSPVPALLVAAYEICREGAQEPRYWGNEFKDLMKFYSTHLICFETGGLTPGDGEVTIDTNGEPIASFHPSEEHKKIKNDVYSTLREVIEGNGGEFLHVSHMDTDKVGTAHQMGTCRMGSDPSKSVTDEFGEVWGYPKLFVIDGSIIPTATGVNPALTIATVAERCTKHIIKKYFMK
jgi:choline dehydrogenase-like flavoprotein